jgi:phosphotriesterase-related protein
MAVNTVLGPVSAEELGTTLMHEHCLWAFPGWEYDLTYPFNRESALQIVEQDLIALKREGVDTLVDTTAPSMGRDAAFLEEVSQHSGIQIIASTGFYTEHWGGIPFSLSFWSLDELTAFMVTELTEGMDGTLVKAGLIKVGTGEGEITEMERKTFIAAARAHLKTGAPIYTHTHKGTMVSEQLDIFESEHVDLSKVVIGHLSDTMNLNCHLEVVRRGANVGLDRIGIEAYQTSREHVQLVAAMVAGGYTHQLVMSQDTTRVWLGHPPKFPGRPSVSKSHLERPFTRLLREFIPKLEKAGISRETIWVILRENPRRIFQST